jgi:fructose-1,6-bisphosphatase/inositol monophosphatase family enzyme
VTSTPGPAELAELERVAVELTREAGDIALRALREPPQVEYKDDKRTDPVTLTDRAIEEFLATGLRERYPGHGLLGEEGSDEALEAEYLWVADPLDGTANFANGLPLFAVSLALLHHGAPVVGCLFIPIGPGGRAGVLYAARGRGARFSPTSGRAGTIPAPTDGEPSLADESPPTAKSRSAGKPAAAAEDAREPRDTPPFPAGEGGRRSRPTEGHPAAVGDADEPIRVAGSDAPGPRLAALPGVWSRLFRLRGDGRKALSDTRNLGSVCLECGMVATGGLRWAFFSAPKLWDVAAATLIVQEAGGLARTWDGRRWQEVERYAAPGGTTREGKPRTLRHWSRPVLIGGPDSVELVAAHLHWRPGPPRIVRRLLRAWGQLRKRVEKRPPPHALS